MWIKASPKQSVSVPDTKPENCPSEAITLRVRAASPHSFSSCRLGNGIGGLTAGGKERRGTQRNHMTASHLITPVFGFWVNCWTQSENRSDCLSPRPDLRDNWSEIGKCYGQLISKLSASRSLGVLKLAANMVLTLLSSMTGDRQWGRQTGMELVCSSSATDKILVI